MNQSGWGVRAAVLVVAGLGGASGLSGALGACGGDAAGGEVGADTDVAADSDRGDAIEEADGDVAEIAADVPGLGIDYGDGGVVLRYEPAAREFTATPWPSDRLLKDGHVDLGTFPNPNEINIIQRYLEYGEEVLDGWSRNGSVYFQLSAPLDPASLPSAETTMSEPKAAVQLVDVTPGGAHYGERRPLLFEQVDGKDDPFYLGPTLAVRPVFGFPLADRGTYCAFVTRALKGADGKYLAANPAFDTALSTEPSLGPLRAWLEDAPVLASDLASATCFTTQDATREMRILEAFIAGRPSTAPEELVYTGKTQNFYEVVGWYHTPNFQSGDKPYRDEGGDLKLDEAGQPIVQEDERVRFRLLIPRNSEMPAAGWPIILYSHGTFGDWKTCVEGSEAEAVREGLAMICVDQPLHGARRVNPNEEVNYLDVFNFLNPRSGRMTFRQSAVDTMWLSKMVTDGRFDLAADATEFGQVIKLDPATIVFFGHSHGGLAGTIVLASDARIKGAVLSGASGVMIETILLRKDPLDISSTLALVLGVLPERLDTFHPAMTLAQTLVDATDPINYAPYWLNPVTGGNSKHVFMTEGTMDEASPAVGADAVAAAAGIPLLNPVAEVSPAHVLRHLEPVSMPVNSNLLSSNGQVVTGAIRQFKGGDHFVALTDPTAIQIWRGFFRAFRDKDIPTIQR